jgi:hypothetical protein
MAENGYRLRTDWQLFKQACEPGGHFRATLICYELIS